MITTTSRSTRLRNLATAGTIAAALALVGCSSDTAAEEPATPEESAPAETNEVDDRLAAFLSAADEYTMPTEKITDGAALEGKKIYYIPVTNKAPAFVLTGKLIEEAVTAAGATLQICDGEANPTSLGACIDGARNDANVGGIITDGWFYGMAANALNAAQEAGVPVVYGNQFESPDFPTSDTLGYVNSPGIAMATSILTWAEVDSEGTANVLFIKSSDGPGTQMFAAEASATFKSECAECTYTEIEVTTATTSQLEGNLNTQLLQDPNIGYVMPQFAQYLPNVIPTVRASGSQAQIATTAATLGAVQAVAAGDVAAAAGQSAPFGAWAYVDQLLRLVNGQPTFDYELPIRLFTADNVADIDVSEAGEASGAWFGPTNFADKFKTLWGK